MCTQHSPKNKNLDTILSEPDLDGLNAGTQHTPRNKNLHTVLSEPDLRSPGSSEFLTPTRNFTPISKRKQPDPDVGIIKEELAMFRKEMMAFFKGFAVQQKEDIAELKENLVEIRDEIKTMRDTTDNLTLRYKDINQEVSELKTENSDMRDKLKTLESDIKLIKTTHLQNEQAPSTSGVCSTSYSAQEDMFHELEERQRRMNNIIVVGIKEPIEKNAKIRQKHDQDQVMEILKKIYENKDCPTPLKYSRLGKYNPDKTRLIKVSLQSTDEVKFTLRNKSKLPENTNIRVYADQTPAQKAYLHTIQEELKTREKNGELDIGIKYIKGIPKIVKNPSKN